MTAEVLVNGRLLERWQDYSVENDMLTPADAFTLKLAPATRGVYDLVPPDSEVEVRIDGTRVLSGFIDVRSTQIERSGTTLSITGRDRAGRMVDESAPLQVFPVLDIETLASQLALPTFPAGAVLSNAENRDLVRGRRSGKAEPGVEPIFAKRSKAPKKVEPGQTRWDILQAFLEPANLLAWSQADGSAIVVGLPNYSQGTQFRFFLAGEDSLRVGESNVLSATVTESVAERFSRIQIVGASRGNSANYGSRVTKHAAEVRNNPATLDGTGIDFRTSKLMIFTDDDVKNIDDANDRVIREFRLREAERLVLELKVQGHTQSRNRGDVPALYGFDMMADVEIEDLNIAGRFIITKATFEAARGGETTNLTLVPEGTILTM